MRLTSIFLGSLFLGAASFAFAQAQPFVQGGTTFTPIQQPPGAQQPGQTQPMPPGITPVQPGTTPQRMPARPLRPGETPPKGTAVIKGQVRADVTGAPVRRAQVRAMSVDGRGAGGGVTSTDANGNFELKELAAGRYNITAMKGGFVQGQYGQRRPGEPGTLIELSDGQTAEKVNFVLSRGGVITGRIVDDAGEPVSGTQVMAMRFQFMGGTRRLVPGGGEGSSDRTDDQGTYRLFGLAPGDYFVSAANRNMQFVMPEMNNTELDGFAPTYYPGTSSIGEATRITLRSGQEMSGAHFQLISGRMARVRGRVLTSKGEPVGRSMLMLMPADPMLGGGMGFSAANNAMVGADGAFQFANIAPGRYNLVVRPMSMPDASGESATVPITVNNEDIENLIVTTAPGAIARGVITTDDGTPPPFRADQVQIFPQPIDPNNMMMGSGPPRINEDYSFEMTGVFDRRIIRGSIGTGMSQGNLGWSLKAVLWDGQDVTDTGIEFTPGRTYEGLQVIFTQKVTDLSGALTDDRNTPVIDATVIVFPANRERWTFQSRYLRSVRPDTNGRYTVRNLPPGEDYLVIAVRNLEQGQFSDPEFLGRAADAAKSFSLNEGETKVVDIKVSSLVP